MHRKQINKRMRRYRYILKIYWGNDATIECRYYPTRKAAEAYVEREGIIAYDIDREDLVSTRYIVVAFSDGIGHTLLTNNKFKVFFDRHALVYKLLKCAVNKAFKMSNEYRVDKVCVFKVRLGEELNCCQYKDWLKDDNRLMYSIEND